MDYDQRRLDGAPSSGETGSKPERRVDYPYRIVFIRHGETSYNAEGRLQGQRDIPLNGKGREQASAVGRSLRKRMGAEIDALEAAGAFWASPLGRTRETMELARAAMGLPPQAYQLSDDLKELTFGIWEGRTWLEVEVYDPAGAKAREADKWNFAPPQGESYEMLAQRLRPWLEAQCGDCFVTSHGGVARALMYLIAGIEPRMASSVSVHQGRAIVFEAGGYRWVG